MKQIEKIAARMPAAKHLAALWKRVAKPPKRVVAAIPGAKRGQTFYRPKETTRRKELAKALRATKRETKKLVRGREPELTGIALGLPAAAGITYGIHKAREKKEK
jgi:hypothetical protein